MEQDAQGNWYLRVPLIGETARRLESLAEVCGVGKAEVAASLLHDILEDDEAAHVSPEQVARENGFTTKH